MFEKFGEFDSVEELIEKIASKIEALAERGIINGKTQIEKALVKLIASPFLINNKMYQSVPKI